MSNITALGDASVTTRTRSRSQNNSSSNSRLNNHNNNNTSMSSQPEEELARHDQTRSKSNTSTQQQEQLHRHHHHHHHHHQTRSIDQPPPSGAVNNAVVSAADVDHASGGAVTARYAAANNNGAGQHCMSLRNRSTTTTSSRSNKQQQKAESSSHTLINKDCVAGAGAGTTSDIIHHHHHPTGAAIATISTSQELAPSFSVAATDTLSSSKTLPLNNTYNGHHRRNSDQSGRKGFLFPKDLALHLACSALLLVAIAAPLVCLVAPRQLLSSFHARLTSSWVNNNHRSNQVEELRDYFKLSLQLASQKVEEKVERIKVEMKEEIKRTQREVEEHMREEMKRELRDKLMIHKEELAVNTNVDDHTSPNANNHIATTTSDPSWTSVIERPDYALASGGGHILGHSPPYLPSAAGGVATRGLAWLARMFALRPQIHPLAPVILQPSFNQPGHCLPLAGSNVYVEMALRTSIYPDQITLTHVSKNVAYDISSAPKDFHIYGSPPPLTSRKPPSWILLGQFQYDVDRQQASQIFHLSETNRKMLVSSIKLHVLSNHGSPSHTCIYRVHVHGKEPSSS